MKRILVFKTSVHEPQLGLVKPVLDKLMDKNEQWNFDLEDCDHILRVEAFSLQAHAIIEHLDKAGFSCIELQD